MLASLEVAVLNIIYYYGYINVHFIRCKTSLLKYFRLLTLNKSKVKELERNKGKLTLLIEMLKHHRLKQERKKIIESKS